MDAYMVALRLIHIFSGVFWAGTVFFSVSYLTPAVAATGQEGQAFMRHLGLKTNLSPVLAGLATLTAVSGLLMYGNLFGFDADSASSTYSLVLGLSGIAGISGWFVGFFISFRANRRMKALSEKIAASGGPPSPEQIGEMQALAERFTLGARITAVLLVLALIGMSGAQYVA